MPFSGLRFYLLPSVDIDPGSIDDDWTSGKSESRPAARRVDQRVTVHHNDWMQDGSVVLARWNAPMDGSRQPQLKLQWSLRALSSLAPETAPGRLEAYSGRRGRPGKPGFTLREHPGPWAPAWAGWRAISVIGLVGAP